MLHNLYVFRFFRPAVSVVLLAALIPISTAAQTIFVDTNEDPVPGSSATNGRCSLAEAIWNVNAGAQPYPDCGSAAGGNPQPQTFIVIDSGIGDIVLSSVLILEQAARIIGPSPTDKAVIRPAGPIYNGGLVIRTAFDVPMDFELVNLRFEDHQKIAGVLVPPPCDQEDGAAVCASLASRLHSLTARDVEFVGNSAQNSVGSSAGGAMAVFYTGPTSFQDRPMVLIESSRFENNVAADAGGALFFSQVDATLRNVLFDSNFTQRGSGAAIKAQEMKRLVVDDSTFVANEEINGDGAAIWFSGDNLFVFDSRILDNTAFENINSALVPNRGAVVRAGPRFTGPPANVVMNNIEIADNNAAGLLLEETIALFSRSSIHGNLFDSPSALELSGAGISVANSTLDLVNASIIGNLGRVGGIDARNSILELNHATIGDNTANGLPETGGIRLDNASTANLDGTLMAGNSGSNGNVLVVGGSTLSAYSSQFGDSASEINGSDSANLFNDVSSLDVVQDMGCTVPAGNAGWTRCVRLAPLTASALALDRSDPATQLTSDQRGSLFTRATGGGNLPDIGAHELQPPIISIDPNTNTARNEGNTGTTSFLFILQRNGDRRNSSFANWNVLGDGASPANVADFSATGGSAFFDIGDSSATVDIGVVGDLDSEPNEGFRLQLAALTNGVQGTNSSRTGTIINDDALLPVATVSIAPIAINILEGDFLIGSEQILRVTRSQLVGGICSFQARLSAVGPAGVNNDDFVTWNLGTSTYVMQPGEEFIDIVLQVAGDGAYEGDEAYRMELINPSGCFVDNTAASIDGLIVDDESLYGIGPDVALFEGNSGTTPYTFEVSRAGYLAESGSVDWEVVGFGGLPALADDFAGGVFPSGTALFLPGSDQFTITVEVIADDIGEFDEQFAVVISNPFSGEIGIADAVGTIVNDDASDLLFSDGFE